MFKMFFYLYELELTWGLGFLLENYMINVGSWEHLEVLSTDTQLTDLLD